MKKCALALVLLFLALVGWLLPETMHSEKEIKPPKPMEVIRLLDKVGIFAEDATFVHLYQSGRPPVQKPQDVCIYNVKWKDAKWKVGVDAITLKIVKLWGVVAFVPGGKPERIRRHEDAVRLADIWFRRFGVEIEKTIVIEVERINHNGGIWRVARAQLIAPNILVRAGADIELDEVTGGLISFSLDPEFVIPSPLPKPVIPSEKAIELALKWIATARTEHYEPSKEAELLDCYQLITWKRKPNDKLAVSLCWSMRFYGRAKQISRLPPEFQKLSPPQVVPVLWYVLVDAMAGEVDIHWVSRRNELFTNGRLYRW